MLKLCKLKRKHLPIIVGILFCSQNATSQAQSKQEITRPFIIEKVADNIWAALKPAKHRIIDSNIVIIESNDCLTIVDANDNLKNARKLTKSITELSKKPVCYVINTHWHSDHVLANQIYQKAFKNIKAFVGHDSLPKLIETKTRKQLDDKIAQWDKAIIGAKEKLKSGNAEKDLAKKIENAEVFVADLKSLKLIKPQITFKDSLNLPVEGLTVQLLNFGKAHTEGDTIIYIPERKLLISGDLFDHLPFAGHGYPSEWLHTLKAIERLDFDTVIPGHGAIQVGKGDLIRIRELLEESLALAKEAKMKKISKEDFVKSIDLPKYRKRFGELDELGERVFKQFIPEFFERAYLEVSKEI